MSGQKYGLRVGLQVLRELAAVPRAKRMFRAILLAGALELASILLKVSGGPKILSTSFLLVAIWYIGTFFGLAFTFMVYHRRIMHLVPRGILMAEEIMEHVARGDTWRATILLDRLSAIEEKVQRWKHLAEGDSLNLERDG